MTCRKSWVTVYLNSVFDEHSRKHHSSRNINMRPQHILLIAAVLAFTSNNGVHGFTRNLLRRVIEAKRNFFEAKRNFFFPSTDVTKRSDFCGFGNRSHREACNMEKQCVPRSVLKCSKKFISGVRQQVCRVETGRKCQRVPVCRPVSGC